MFYCLSSYNSGRFCYVTYPWDYYDTKETKCDSCGRTIQNIQLNYWPPRFSLEGAKKYPDLLIVVTPFENKCGMIISEKALQVFQTENISGFFAEPIEVCDNPKNAKSAKSAIALDVPNYYYIYINGNISLDYQKMHYRKKNVCNECGQYTWSRQKIGESALDYSTWDQSDICKLTDYPNIFVCTQRVIDAIKQNKLKGFAKASEKDIFRVDNTNEITKMKG